MSSFDFRVIADKIGVSILTTEHLREFDLFQTDISGIFRKFSEPIPVLVLQESSEVDIRKTGERLRSHGVFHNEQLSIIMTASRSAPFLRNSFDGRRTAVLDFEEVMSAARSATPRAAIRNQIRQRVLLEYLTPYNTNYVTPHTMFYGRERELADIDKGANDNFIIVGPRRIGKSSLAREVQRMKLKESGLGPRLSGPSKNRYAYTVAYVDCNLLPDFGDVEALFESLLASMNLEARDTIQNRHLFGRRERNLAPFEFFEKLIRTKYRALTIIIDEIDGLLETDKKRSWSVLRKLQGLVDQIRTVSAGAGTLTNVILVGFSKLYSAMYDDSFPFFGRCKRIVVGNLGRDAVEKLISEPLAELGFRIRERQQVLDRIMDETGGMPSIVQSICDEAIKRLQVAERRSVTPDLVQAIIADRYPLEDHLNWFDYHANDLEKTIVYYMNGESRLRVSDFIQFMETKGNTSIGLTDIRLPLDHLALANILHEVDRHEVYEYAVDAFRRAIVSRPHRDKELQRLVKRLTKG